MNENPNAGKVGAFAAVSLLLLGVLLLSFSKGLRWFTPTYELNLRATTVAGLKSGSLVMMSGVEIGAVAGADVAPDGRGVKIRLRIRKQYPVHADARIVIEQLGFLGDQYVAIYPRENRKAVLKSGDEIVCEEPFNLQEVVRSTTGLIQRVDDTVKILNEAMRRIDATLLSDRSLSNLQESFVNFRALSERSLGLAEQLDRILRTNAPPIGVLLSNLVRFSETVSDLAAETRQMVGENREEVSGTIKTLESVAGVLDGMAKELRAGKGLAGALLTDEQLKNSLISTITSLETLSSNLNRFGLLYKPRPPKAPRSGVLTPPKN